MEIVCIFMQDTFEAVLKAIDYNNANHYSVHYLEYRYKYRYRSCFHIIDSALKPRIMHLKESNSIVTYFKKFFPV